MEFSLAYFGIRTLAGPKIASALCSTYIFWTYVYRNYFAAADILYTYLVLDTIMNVAEWRIEVDILIHHAATMILLCETDPNLSILFFMELTTPLIQLLRLVDNFRIKMVLFGLTAFLWIPTRIALPIVLLRYVDGLVFASVLTLFCLNVQWLYRLVRKARQACEDA